MLKIRFLLLFIIISIIFLILLGCNSNNKIVNTLPSPNGEYIVYVFIRDLGATTKESYQMSILNKNDKLGNGSGNTFVSYSDFAVVWEKDMEITIKYPKKAEVFKKEESVKGVKIKYYNEK